MSGLVWVQTVCKGYQQTTPDELKMCFPYLVYRNSFRNTIRVLNSLDPDQGQRFVGPDLDPNYLQRLSADDT